MNYYRRYSGDYLRDTASLSLTEHGAYSLLLDYAYATERPIPGDRDEVFRLLRAMSAEERKAVDKVLAKFWVLSEDGYRNPRVEQELAKATVLIDRQKANGSLGGRPRKTQQETQTETQQETQTITQKNHPPTSNHQPPASNLQPPGVKRRAAASARTREDPEKSPVEAGPDPEPLPQPSAAAALAVDLRKAGIACTSADPRLLEILASDPARRHIDDAIGIAQMRKPGESIAIGYLAAIHRDCITRAQRPTATEVRPSSADDILERNLAVARRVAATLAGGRQP